MIILCFVSYLGDTVLMVAGGWDTPNYSHLDSVEVLTVGSSSWIFATPLPRAMTYMQAAKIDETVLLFGGGTPSSSGLQAHSGKYLCK